LFPPRREIIFSCRAFQPRSGQKKNLLWCVKKPADMPDSPEAKCARAKAHYAANTEEQRIKANIRSILKGKKPNAKTLAAYRWGERKVNRIRSMDANFRQVLEHIHGVGLRKVYANATPLPAINLPRV
jgi:hypothetical protein